MKYEFLINNCSVHSRTEFDKEFEIKDIFRECLVPFPYIWASVNRVLICGTC
jgi:hypothetical protein